MAPKLRLLIVEDDPMMQLGLGQALGEQFAVVGYAEDGYGAIDLTRQLQPQVVIMDIGLPRLDGIAATQRLKREFPDIHVVMLTSHQSALEAVAALSSGADAYCIKGETVERLLMAIAAAQEGATYLDPQIARHVIQHLHPPQPTMDYHLSQRELDVLKLMVEGYSNPEIAGKLFLSPNTVKTHVRGILNKLAVDDRVQAAVVALRNGLV